MMGWRFWYRVMHTGDVLEAAHSLERGNDVKRSAVEALWKLRAGRP
jgi:hypothetical protein